MIEYIAEKPAHYFRDPRWALVRWVREGQHRVLDVGCGEGRTAAALKAAGKAVEVVGVEKHPAIAKLAADGVDRVICADVEETSLPLEPGYFSYILLGDILEHLRNPWAVLKHLSPCLCAGGRIIASIPNVRHWRVVGDLVLRGEWEYKGCGVLDDGHLRFFTRRSIDRLFESSGLVVERMTPEFRGLLPSERSLLRRVTLAVDRMTLGLFEGFLTLRYIVEARKP